MTHLPPPTNLGARHLPLRPIEDNPEARPRVKVKRLIVEEPRAVDTGKSPSWISRPEQPNARHHPPPRAIDLHESRRVGGRVHAVVRCAVSINIITFADGSVMFSRKFNQLYIFF